MVEGDVVILPAQQQNRGFRVRLGLGLALDLHGGILEVTGKGLEFVALILVIIVMRLRKGSVSIIFVSGH